MGAPCGQRRRGVRAGLLGGVILHGSAWLGSATWSGRCRGASVRSQQPPPLGGRAGAALIQCAAAVGSPAVGPMGAIVAWRMHAGVDSLTPLAHSHLLRPPFGRAAVHRHCSAVRSEHRAVSAAAGASGLSSSPRGRCGHLHFLLLRLRRTLRCHDWSS